MKNILKNILKDISVDLTDEFDRNFERKAFFTDKWNDTKYPNSIGTTLMRSGNLRSSITCTTDQNSVSWTSSLPYATLQNNGGEITITEAIKNFFWAMYYESGKKNEAFKAMALKKVGSKIKIEARPFIGNHPEVNRIVEQNIDHNVAEGLKEYMKKISSKQ